MKYLSILILLFLFISCSKDSSSGTQPSYDTTCQITSVKWVSGIDSFTTILSYNSNGKLSKTDDHPGLMVLYTYDENKIFKLYNSDTPMDDTTTLNNFGHIAEFVHYSTSFVFSTFFFYISDTVLSYSVTKSSPITGPPDTTTYHFTDGDLSSFVINGITYNYTYYTDKNEQPADLSIYKQMINLGTLSYTNKHLTKSYSSNSFSEEYTYTYDVSGKILSITDHYSDGQIPGTITYYYTYACHL